MLGKLQVARKLAASCKPIEHPTSLSRQRVRPSKVDVNECLLPLNLRDGQNLDWADAGIDDLVDGGTEIVCHNQMPGSRQSLDRLAPLFSRQH